VASCCEARRDAARAAASLERLLVVCRPVAERMAHCYVQGEADVADVAQEALVYVARHLSELREPAAFPHWFAAVVHSVGRQWLRRGRRRSAERSLEQLEQDGPWASSRAQWLIPSHAAAWDGAHVLGAIEAVDAVHRLLRILQPREREVVVRFYLDDEPQRDICRRMSLTSKAVESLLYRAVRRLRLVGTQCGDEMEDLFLWCPGCGACRLRGRLQPGDAPERPLALRATCPRFTPGNNEAYNLLLPRPHYPSVDAALLAGMALLGGRLQACARAAQPRCVYCGGALRPSRRSDVLRGLSWRCRTCPASLDGGLECVAAAVPELHDLWLTTPRLRFGRNVIVGAAGGDRVRVEAADAGFGGIGTAAGGGFTLTLAADTLEICAVDVRR
jgi:RNA polymerase sigma factor (sigma-70 family)